MAESAVGSTPLPAWWWRGRRRCWCCCSPPPGWLAASMFPYCLRVAERASHSHSPQPTWLKKQKTIAGAGPRKALRAREALARAGAAAGLALAGRMWDSRLREAPLPAAQTVPGCRLSRPCRGSSASPFRKVAALLSGAFCASPRYPGGNKRETKHVLCFPLKRAALKVCFHFQRQSDPPGCSWEL